MPYAIILTGSVDIPDGDLVIGFAAGSADDSWRLPVISDLPRMDRLQAAQGTFYYQAVPVVEQFPNGLWKMPVQKLTIPVRDSA